MRSAAICLVLLTIAAIDLVVAEDQSVPDGTIYGHVYDADTNHPLSQAFVYCQDIKCSKPTTDSTGYYATDSCFSPSKTYTIQCTKHGYETATKSVTTNQDGKAVADFNLEPEGSKPANVQANQISPDSGLITNPQDAEIWINKGRDFERVGKYNDSVDAYNRAIEINPNLAEAWLDKVVPLDNMGKHSDAMQAIDKAIEIDPNFSSAWYLKAQSLIDQKNPEDAIKAFNNAIEIDPRSPQALSSSIYIGFALMDQGEYDEAIKIYDKIIAIDPNSIENILDNKGYALSHVGKYDEALQAFDLAIGINRNNYETSDAWEGKGDVFRSQNKYEDAIKCYDEAIRINSDNSIAWENKGLALQKLGRTSESDAAFAKVKELKRLGKFMEADYQPSSK